MILLLLETGSSSGADGRRGGGRGAVPTFSPRGVSSARDSGVRCREDGHFRDAQPLAGPDQGSPQALQEGLQVRPRPLHPHLRLPREPRLARRPVRGSTAHAN